MNRTENLVCEKEQSSTHLSSECHFPNLAVPSCENHCLVHPEVICLLSIAFLSLDCFKRYNPAIFCLSGQLGQTTVLSLQNKAATYLSYAIKHDSVARICNCSVRMCTSVPSTTSHYHWIANVVFLRAQIRDSLLYPKLTKSSWVLRELFALTSSKWWWGIT